MGTQQKDILFLIFIFESKAGIFEIYPCGTISLEINNNNNNNNNVFIYRGLNIKYMQILI